MSGIENLENHMVLDEPEPAPEIDGDALHDEQRQNEVDAEALGRQARRAELRFRISLCISHLTRTNAFDKQDLVQLLKDVNKELA